MNENEMKIGIRYNLETVAPEILGRKHDGLILEGIINAVTAQKLSPVAFTHQQVLPFIQSDDLKEFSKNQFYLFNSSTGSSLILAQSWIKAGSIQVNGDAHITLRIHNATKRDIPTIRSILGLSGFSRVSVVEK